MRHLVLTPLMCLTLMWNSMTGSAVQAAEPQTLIPAEAVAVIRVKAPESTIAKVVSMVNVVQEGFGSLVEQQASMIGVGIMNPALTGVDQSRDWWMAVFTRGESEPVVAFVIPATDVAQMQSALDEKLFFTSVEDWAVYSEDEAAVEAVKTLAAGEGKSFQGLLRDRSQQIFNNGDLSVMVNVDVLTANYRAEIEQAKRDAESEVQNMPNELPEIPGMNLDWLADLAPQVLNGVFKTVDETEQIVEAILISDQGVKFESTIDFTSGGDVAGYLAKLDPEALTLLNRLPADHLGYFAFGGGGMNELQNFAFEIMKKIVVDPDKKAQVEALVNDAKELEIAQGATSFGLGDLATGLIRSVAVYKATPVETAKKIVRKSAVFANLVEVPGVTQSLQVQEDAETYGSRTADVMILEQTFEGENAELGGLQQQIMTMMYGPEGVVTRIGYLEDGYVQSLGGGTEGMESAMSAYENSANADNGAFRRDRGHLQENANLVGMLDLATLIADGVKIAASSGMVPIPVTPEDIDSIVIEKSFLGFSMAASEAGLEFNTFIPVQTVQNGFKIFMFVQSMQQQGQAF